MADMFNEADTNGDGQLSRDEAQAHAAAVEERMQKLSGGLAGLDMQQSQTLDSLLESLTSDESQQSHQPKLNQMLDKLRNEGYSEQNVSDSISMLNDVIPPVDIMA